MNAEPVPSRALTLACAAIAIASLAVVLTLYGPLVTPQLLLIGAFAAVAIAVAAANPLLVRGLRMRRSGMAVEAIFLDVSVAAPLILAFGTPGAVVAAGALAAGFGAASWLCRSGAPTDIFRHGVVRLLALLAIVPFATPMAASIRAVGAWAPAAGAIAVAGALLALTFAVSAPLSAAIYGLHPVRVVARVARDPRTWTVMAGNVAWSVVIAGVLAPHANVALAITLWLPVVTTARLQRTLDRHYAEIHRLRLVRDAVQAMLRDKDPLPQINAILATLRVPAVDETVSVLAATSTRTEQWRVVTTLGPALSPAGDELHRRLLTRIKFTGRRPLTLRDASYVAYAFPACERGGREPHGALIVHRRPDRPFTPEQMAQFSTAARELAPLLRDMRSIVAAQSAATIDPLTGLYNRAAAGERLQKMLDETGVDGAGAVLILDIDHFKTINDQLGHAAGDACLRKIGDLIRQGVRGGDTPGRIGGEEFLVVMPRATSEIAMNVAERLRLAIALSGLRYATGEPVTASIGVARGTVGDTSESMLSRADRALYAAKHGGRNRTIEDGRTA